jgi:hypothetical protein
MLSVDRHRLLACCTAVVAACAAPTHDASIADGPVAPSFAGTARDAEDGGRVSVAPPIVDAWVAPTYGANAQKSDAGPPRGPSAACGGASYVAKGKSLEILVLFDASLSMALPAISWECLTTGEGCTTIESVLYTTLWKVAISELMSFARDPRASGVSVALKYFGVECSPDAYATPDVPLGVLPMQATQLQASLEQTWPVFASTTRPALEGALSFVRKRNADPGHNARDIVLIITSGLPDEASCEDNSNTAVSRVAAQGLAEQSSTSTYVFVTAPDLPLDDIARAGGTEQAILADLSKAGTLSEALLRVVEREVAALPCEYELPREYFERVNDPTLVNLTRNGVPVAMVRDASACGPAGGWHYDNPAQPKRILTCHSTCVDLKTGGAVDIQLDCPTITLL